MTDRFDIARQIREEVVRRGITQAELGELLGVGQSTVSSWLSGVTDMRLSTVLRIMEVLEMGFEINQNVEFKYTFEITVRPSGHDGDVFTREELRAVIQETIGTTLFIDPNDAGWRVHKITEVEK